jgi:hypothetical protein
MLSLAAFAAFAGRLLYVVRAFGRRETVVHEVDPVSGRQQVNRCVRQEMRGNGWAQYTDQRSSPLGGLSPLKATPPSSEITQSKSL